MFRVSLQVSFVGAPASPEKGTLTKMRTRRGVEAIENTRVRRQTKSEGGTQRINIFFFFFIIKNTATE